MHSLTPSSSDCIRRTPCIRRPHQLLISSGEPRAFHCAIYTAQVLTAMQVLKSISIDSLDNLGADAKRSSLSQLNCYHLMIALREPIRRPKEELWLFNGKPAKRPLQDGDKNPLFHPLTIHQSFSEATTTFELEQSCVRSLQYVQHVDTISLLGLCPDPPRAFCTITIEFQKFTTA